MSTEQNVGKRPRRSKATGDTNVEVEKVEVDFLILADWADSINGKLYVQGGGWDRRLLPPAGQPVSFAMAAGILVPWHLTNQQHNFSLSIKTGDGIPIGQAVEGGFNMGRPVNSTPGQKFRASLAVRIDAKISEFGTYRLCLVVNSDVAKYATFYVVEKL
jgi:hypothetical protein